MEVLKMLKPTTHFDQVPLHEIIEVVKKEAQKLAVEPKRSNSSEALDSDLLKKSSAAKNGELQ
jgi:hypothetical protein